MVGYTPNYLLQIPAPGDPAQTNAWGTMENTGRTLVDTALGGMLSLPIPGTGITILTSLSGAPDQSRNAHYIFTGALTGNSTVLWPQNCGRMFSVTNSTTGAFTLVLGANNGSGAVAGTTVTIPQDFTALVYSDGTNVVLRQVGFIGTQPGPLVIGNAVGALTVGDGSAACTTRIFSNDAFALRIFNGVYSTTLAAILGMDPSGQYLQFSNGAGGGLSRIDQVTGVYSVISDEAMKTKSDVQVDYMPAIRALWLGDFTYKANGHASFGPFAQQAYSVLGDLGATPGTDQMPWTVNPATYGYLSLWAVQKLAAKCDALEARLAALEAKSGL